MTDHFSSPVWGRYIENGFGPPEGGACRGFRGVLPLKIDKIEVL